MLSLKTPTRELKRIERELQREQRKINAVITRSLNRAMVTGRKVADKSIRAELAIKSKDVKKRLEIRKATRSRQEASIRTRVQPVPAVNYPHSPNRRGVSVKFSKQRGRILFKGAFLARHPGGHLGIFRRVCPGRSPIEEIFGPSIAEKFAEVIPLAEPEAQRQLEKELEANLKYFSGKL